MREFTSKKTAAGKPFKLDGEVFQSQEAGAAAVLDMSTMAKLAIEGRDTADPEAIAALGQFFEAVLGAAEYQRFKDHVRKHNTDNETLIEIMFEIGGYDANFPTRAPLPSSNGDTSIPLTSRVFSDSGVSAPEPITEQRAAELRAAVGRAAA